MATLDGLPPLRDVIQRHGLDAKKSLGQNFLFDLNLTQKIARSAGSLEGVTVFEVGPGPGGLTRSILALGAKKVIAVERDARALPVLAEVSDFYPGRLEVIEGDALKTDFAALAAEKADGGPVKIIANLPYNVGTQLLLNWLLPENGKWPPFWESLTLMFQKEVGLRIVADEEDDHYGRLGVICGWRTDAHMVFDVPPQAFSPPPKVTSTVVHLTPKAKPLPCDANKLERITHAAFGQRRKMLRQSLKPVGGETLLNKVGIDPQRRAETLSVEEFVALANAL
ncbi:MULTISPECIES: 16S rRNA (adenine(1518)-N(6)/adenine(1519)-N(6))-dimethyltransferase RsmA [Rhizobiaceae]|jgi:16S rRNA (adenine1518-N6/adenine1519-N6)-dimethyltransferase|uniref:Ribosomal RNA small subunit methyltransferase A n=1 Tax=Aliirhizobium cellulosilyticum TaxID=393664 RepID=A0A7W6Y3H6_9HYPH|nr:16S rRNA (adenine(1518)-N(6)/adenine(1519)-N(6))-dimethyltransferase RsmA [Rhizobium cellulosilyticum]MBB4350470.1 16S rRNA (adenine1518-N6/adenine1519-N6)-dimethyltransferase [Rhizobium cellulosilyticum]MBB4413498.1 16S rRNA (adenine1518-N6/adenine1519-N6)-dimethyltransferase [Rhizobium cellulosilyticum]MBB4448131.1 16S rRNA (adenine1518-N6/adenine1519-N6)-dimethyltransferase [Rhizobium cellulosilyticum]